MYFFSSIRCFIFLQYFYFVTICNGEGEPNKFYALVLTKTNGEFQFTRPNRNDYETNISHFQTPREGQTYRFCTGENESDKMYLKEHDTIEPDNETTDGNVCKSPVYATFLQVFNPGKFKNIAWNSKAMELFHAGFLLENDSEMIDSSKIQPMYSKDISKHTMVVQFELYYSNKIKQTVAAEYQLISTPIQFFRFMAIHGKTQLPKNVLLRTISPLFFDVDSPKYVEHFKGKIKEKWIKKMLTDSERNPLSLLEFASYEHFTLSLWTIPCKFPLNYIPLWKITKLTWLKVEIFARIVANNLGDLKVTAGVTGTMTLGLSRTELVDKFGFKMPKYFWKVFQYNKFGQNYGIIVVLNCNPFEKTKKKLCETEISCEEHGWMSSNEDYTTGEIYCCNMTNPNIKNLGVDLLSLNENPIFNVNNLSQKLVAIKEEYDKVISREQYKIPSGVTEGVKQSEIPSDVTEDRVDWIVSPFKTLWTRFGSPKQN